MQNTGNLFCFLLSHYNRGKKEQEIVKTDSNIDIIQYIHLQIKRNKLEE